VKNSRVARLVALALGIIVLAGVGVGVAAAKGGDKKFTVWEEDKSGPSTWLPLAGPHKGDPGSAIGDQLLEHKTLYDSTGGRKVGEAITRVAVADLKGSDQVFNVDCTIKLTGGDIVFYGAGLFSKFATGATFPVTGGTGKYRGARGAVTVKLAELNGKPGANLTFNLK